MCGLHDPRMFEARGGTECLTCPVFRSPSICGFVVALCGLLASDRMAELRKREEQVVRATDQ